MTKSRPEHAHGSNGLQPATKNYRYDRLNRLRSETGRATQNFTLDENGNRMADGQAIYSIGLGSNRQVTRSGTALAQDGAGNLLNDQARLNGALVNRSYTYGPAGRLRTVLVNGVQVASYAYDASGQRIRKTLANPPVSSPVK